MLLRPLRTPRTPDNRALPADGPLAPPSELPDLTTSLPLVHPEAVSFDTEPLAENVAVVPGLVPVPAMLPDAVPDGLPGVVPQTVSVTDPTPAPGGSSAPGRVADLLHDALVSNGPATAAVTRRAQHRRRRRFSASGQPRIGLAAASLSAAAMAVLAAGTVQGLRADDERALLDGPSQSAQDSLLAAQDGVNGDAISPRKNSITAAAQAQEQLRVQAAAQARAQAETQARHVAAQQAAARQAAGQQQVAAAARARQATAAQQASRSATRTAPAVGGSPQAIAQAMLAQRGWSGQWNCLNSLWQRESGWNYRASNPSSGAYGIPQALPGSKMASAGADWATNPATQIRWGLSYIASTYGTPCGAWAHSRTTGWY